MGERNANLRHSNCESELIMGKEGLGDMNETGAQFADFCGQNDLVIGGTLSPIGIFTKTHGPHHIFQQGTRKTT
ncbi:hypothetical protein DPMN_143093 [Dreissena polymorpha]|uniref:Uncharacterized protein n=1 Tax=Dreissena polymorpha TaxID=45954 RepID=A0A9D4GFK1_DREPO|nr:hypothetical protein DPMN_143093 [Dreissena polymorpha]